jgi:hypothetical protein
MVVGGSLILGFFIWKSIEKLWGEHSKKSKNNDDIFPFLKRDALKKWGTKWAQDYEYVNQIILYDAPLKYPIDAKYILYFNFDTSTPQGKKNEEYFNKINAFQRHDILDSGFEEVYCNEPASGFRDEWFLSIVKYPGFNDKYSWVIYQREKRKRT